MRPIFLVHGAWHGAWCWRDVARVIAGRRGLATSVTLTGLGERLHLRDAPPTAEIHIDDIRQAVRFAEASGGVMVLHSYGGLPGTAAAARLCAEQPGIVHHLIYLDARVPEPGERWCDAHDQSQREQRIAAALSRDDRCIPPPPPARFGLTGAEAARAARLMTAQTLSLYDQPFLFDPAALAGVRRTFIHCVAAPRLVPDQLAQRLRDDPSWRYLTLDTGHDAMITEPNAVAEIILSAAADDRAMT